MSSFNIYKVTDKIYYNQEWSRMPWTTLSPSPTGHGSMYVICDNDKRVGYCILSRNFYFNPDYILEIRFLEVRPDYRLQGIATSLLNKVFEDYPKYDFVLNSEYKALPFYAKIGFTLLYKNIYKDIWDEHILIKSEIDHHILINKLKLHPNFESTWDFSQTGYIWDDEKDNYININEYQ